MIFTKIKCIYFRVPSCVALLAKDLCKPTNVTKIEVTIFFYLSCDFLLLLNIAYVPIIGSHDFHLFS